MTNIVAGYTTATDKTGRQSVVIVTKGTFGFPAAQGVLPVLLEQQVPLVTTDVFEGEPGFSAPRYEMDFAPFKPRCDVLLNGSCYAPGGRPVKRVTVGIWVGQIAKSIDVLGRRVWTPGVVRDVAPSEPEPFLVMPFSYGNAYGGIDRPTLEPETHRWYSSNPVGVGFRPRTAPKTLYGQPVPNTQEIGSPIAAKDGDYQPMAFGAVGRSWKERIKWAGTYDERWRKEQYPFLPLDFDDRYYQCAPDDQQTEYLRGGEIVVLVNLTPNGRVEFSVPAMSAPFTIYYKSGQTRRLRGTVDTLLLEPDLGRFTVCARACVELVRSVHEVQRIEIGSVLPQAISGEETQTPAPKPHFRGLAELVAAQGRKKYRRTED